MSDGVRAGALETLEKIRQEQFPDIPADLLEAVFAAETETQFETERKPMIAKLRELVLGGGTGS